MFSNAIAGKPTQHALSRFQMQKLSLFLAVRHDSVDFSAALQQSVHDGKVTFEGSHEQSEFATAEQKREGKRADNWIRIKGSIRMVVRIDSASTFQQKFTRFVVSCSCCNHESSVAAAHKSKNEAFCTDDSKTGGRNSSRFQIKNASLSEECITRCPFHKWPRVGPIRDL